MVTNDLPNTGILDPQAKALHEFHRWATIQPDCDWRAMRATINACYYLNRTEINVVDYLSSLQSTYLSIRSR